MVTIQRDGIMETLQTLSSDIRDRATVGDREGRFPYDDMAALKNQGLFRPIP